MIKTKIYSRYFSVHLLLFVLFLISSCAEIRHYPNYTIAKKNKVLLGRLHNKKIKIRSLASHEGQFVCVLKENALDNLVYNVKKQENKYDESAFNELSVNKDFIMDKLVSNRLSINVKKGKIGENYFLNNLNKINSLQARSTLSLRNSGSVHSDLKSISANSSKIEVHKNIKMLNNKFLFLTILGSMSILYLMVALFGSIFMVAVIGFCLLYLAF